PLGSWDGTCRSRCCGVLCGASSWAGRSASSAVCGIRPAASRAARSRSARYAGRMPARVPRLVKTEALVLGHRRLGDADRIVTLLTPLRGKVDVVAKGALRARSRMAGHLEPPVRVEVVLAHGRSMDIVTQAQAVDLFAPVRNDLDRLSTAMYL